MEEGTYEGEQAGSYDAWVEKESYGFGEEDSGSENEALAAGYQVLECEIEQGDLIPSDDETEGEREVRCASTCIADELIASMEDDYAKTIGQTSIVKAASELDEVLERARSFTSNDEKGEGDAAKSKNDKEEEGDPNVCLESRPKLVKQDAAEAAPSSRDFTLTQASVDSIKASMAKLNISTPEWANVISSSESLLQKLGELESRAKS